MYIPPAFREDRPEILHAAIRASGLAILVSFGPEGPVASHVPMLLDEAAGPHGTLLGHLARANPQWRTAAPTPPAPTPPAPTPPAPGLPAPDLPALAIFPGPDAYITPSWYATKRETGKVVPTWNYVAVHATGPLTFFEDPEALRALVTRLTTRHEAARPSPWAVSDAPADFIAAQLKGIVGFRLEIARLEGKWKMSQNRPMSDRLGVVAGLEQEGSPAAAAVADAVSATLTG